MWVQHHGIQKSSHYDGFGSNFERDIDRVVQMNYFTDEVWASFGQFAIKYKMGVRLFSFFKSGTQNIWCIAHSMYCRVRKFIYLSEHFLNQLVKFLPWNNFEWFVVYSTIRLKGEVNFFIREFLEAFYFPSAVIVWIESL